MARKLISFDWALKKLLRSKANFGILEGFLSELLNEDIKIKEILESEANKETRLDKSNRVDIKVKNSKGEFIIIEVQFNEEWDYLQRILYATSKTITEHISEGNKYNEVIKVISINILYFDLGHGSDYVYHGTTNFIGIHGNDELELTESQKTALKHDDVYQLFPEYYLLKINNFNDKAKNTFDEWVHFLKHEEVKPSFTAKGLKEAKEKLDIMKLSENKRKEYETYIEDRRVKFSELWTATEKGRIEGEIKGEIKGANKEKVKIAKKMYKKGNSLEEITEMTELTLNQLQEILSLKNNKVSEKPKKYSAKSKKKAIKKIKKK